MSEKNVPALRFKGFSEDWERKKLGEMGETFTGLSGKTKNDFGHGNGKYITYMNVFSNPVTSTYITEPIEIDRNQSLVKKGDVFFTTSSETPEEVGMSSVLLEQSDNTYLNSFCFGYRPTEEFDNYYLAYMLRSDEVRVNIAFLAQGISRYNISKVKMMDITIPAPTLPEQTHIGSFFQNLDALISLRQQKLDKLVTTKKAMLSKMFPKNGEAVPELRFAGFSEDWERKKLGEVAPLRGGYAFQSDEFKKYGVPIIRISNILSNGSIGGEFTYYSEQENDDNFFLPNRAILLAMSGATTGKVAMLTKSESSKFYQNQRVGYFTDAQIVDYSFIGILVSSNLFLNQLESVLVAGAQPNVSSKEIDSFEFCFPKYMKEQALIGAFFQKLDSLITLQKQELEKLNTIKKSLLSKMFV